jgi:glycosyltransferase involved in cell wall biosynthesis
VKILLNHDLPFSFAHGGVTNIVRRTQAVLEELGYEVEPLQWWNESQSGDVLFQFCRTSNLLIDYAKAKGMSVVVEQVLTGLVSRPPWKRRLQKHLFRAMKLGPSMFTEPFGWRGFQTVDLHFAPSSHDARVIGEMFDVPSEKIVELPYGIDDAFLKVTRPVQRADHLICTATITERKRVLEVAQAAVVARTPLKVVGKPYAKDDPYFLRFLDVVNRSGGIVEHIPHVASREKLAELLANARGFVLMSTMETVSQSALEAAACGCPLLLPDLEWSRSAFNVHASYSPVTADSSILAKHLAEFYRSSESTMQTFPAKSWFENRRHLKQYLDSLRSA